MSANYAWRLGLTIFAFAGMSSLDAASQKRSADDSHQGSPVAAAVRDATERFRDPDAAIAAGYVDTQQCVSGPQEGAMGVHLVNPALFDGEIDLRNPEALVYEPRDGRLRLVAAEYVTPAAAWSVAHPDEQPTLMGHLFHYVPGPNRYGPAAFYELHVWAWKANPNGLFADWNPEVSCAGYAIDSSSRVPTHAHQ